MTKSTLGALASLVALLATLAPLPAAANTTVHVPHRKVHPMFRRAAAPTQSVTPATSPPPYGYLPCDLYNAYGITSTSPTGAGELIAIIDAWDSSLSAAQTSSDLAAFDSGNGLAGPPAFNVYVQGVDFGSSTNSPDPAGAWATEINLDVQWAHAMAPGASIALVEAHSSYSDDMTAAVSYALGTLRADVVSMSFGVPLTVNNSSDAQFVSANESYFPSTNAAGHGVIYAVSTGDTFGQINWPAVSNHTLAVGGTSLSTASTSAHSTCTGLAATPANESVWGSPGNRGTGGGAAYGLEAQASWQSGFGPAGQRNIPDVAADADASASGVAIVIKGAWQGLIGGTSLSAPLWAGMIARIDQQRAGSSLPGLSTTASTNPFYGAPAADYNDIVTGSGAAVGYDLSSGLGSPKFAALAAWLGAPPGPPTGVTAVAGDGAASVSWTAPVSNGGPPVSSYIVTPSPSGSPKTIPASQTSLVMQSLTNGTAYTFTVVAQNDNGNGVPSAPSTPVTPTSRVAPGTQPTASPSPRIAPNVAPSASPSPRVSPGVVTAQPASAAANASVAASASVVAPAAGSSATARGGLPVLDSANFDMLPALHSATPADVAKATYDGWRPGLLA